tara:strand:- start:2834 stop:3292 length:459 start_codon:yes stop_codon:yes gene_type:complete
VIIKIDNKNNKIASQIREMFQCSYQVEAELLNAVNFPPLQRKLSDFINSGSEFYAHYQSNFISGVVEVKKQKDLTHIQSLVVHPKYFRQGIGRKLVQFVLEKYTSKIFTVETGLKNYPAIKLYRIFNFQEQGQWDTDHGVTKVRFQKIIATE